MKKSRSAEAGWISLIETAMLLFWKKSILLKKPQLKQLIETTWISLYLQQLEQYFLRNQAVFIVEHGFQYANSPAFAISAIADANIAFWHIGRLGILTLGYLELLDSKDHHEAMSEISNRSADWISECLQKNPASNRPLIDLHHIELFLVWYMLWVCGRMSECYLWLSELENRLIVRRMGLAQLPFIESRNRMDLIAEHAAKKSRPSDYSDKSSYLLLMILELCFSLPVQERNELIFRYISRLIRGLGDDGETLGDNQMNLVGWAPPANWADRILGETVTDGTAITLMDLDSEMPSEASWGNAIEEHVTKSREKFPFNIPNDIPRAALILGCIRHRSPLPSEFWRSVIFPLEENPSTSELPARKCW